MEAMKEKSVRNLKPALNDILLDVTWAKIAKRYFGKSSSWMYNKLNGTDGNGGVGGFTDAETEQLKEALLDLSARIRTVAEGL